MGYLPTLACGFYVPAHQAGGSQATDAVKSLYTPMRKANWSARHWRNPVVYGGVHAYSTSANGCALDRNTGGKSCYNEAERTKIATRLGLNSNKETAIHNALKDRCGNDQVCWAGNDIDMIRKAFKPEFKGGQFSWLSTTNIDQVGQQLEKKYSNFKFLGSVAIDFQDYHPLFRDFKLSDYIQDGEYMKIGMVFNTDKHTENSQHWIAMFIDTQKQHILFFDSYGKIKKVPEQVIEFKNILQEQGQELGIPLVFKRNSTQFQKKNTECGVYCLYFISKCLEGVEFDTLVRNPVSDDNVNKYRFDKGNSSYFRHNIVKFKA